MMVKIPDLLGAAQVQAFRQWLDGADWHDGRATAGHVALKAKRNEQLPPGSPVSEQLGEQVLQALAAHPSFLSAALPLKVFPPRFNRYADGGQYGDHIDNAVLSVPGTAHRVRSDLSATLFLSAPEEYDGGELIVQDSYGEHRVKLPAGHLVLYPGSSLHRVTPVTRGTRLASFFWIQSLVRQDAQRSLLFELDQAIQRLSAQVPDSPELARLTGVYHNLLRQWAEA